MKVKNRESLVQANIKLFKIIAIFKLDLLLQLEVDSWQTFVDQFA